MHPASSYTPTGPNDRGDEQLGWYPVGGGPFYPNIIDVEIVGELAYVTSPSAGFYIIDVSNPSLPSLVSFSPGAPRGTKLVGERLFMCENDLLRVFDVSNPIAPVERVALKVLCGDIDARGTNVYVAGGAEGLSIVDLGPEFASAGVPALNPVSWVLLSVAMTLVLGRLRPRR